MENKPTSFPGQWRFRHFRAAWEVCGGLYRSVLFLDWIPFDCSHPELLYKHKMWSGFLFVHLKKV